MQRQDQRVELTTKVLVGEFVVVAAQDRFALGKVTTELSGFFPAALTDAHVMTLRAANREADAASGTRLGVDRLNEVREAEFADLRWD